jgi:membrane associated rhomboid family serine protease
MSIIQDLRAAFTQRDNALKQLIIINVLLYAVLVVLGAILGLSRANAVFDAIMLQLQLPSNLASLARHPWTIFTYFFTHTSFWHILFNMLNLYWFGQLIREYLGDRRLVSLYILGGLAGAAFFLLSYNLIPKLVEGPGAVVIGASGAITAIIVGAATLLPDYTFMLILIGPVRIKYIAAVIVLISIAGVNGGNTGGEIAHLGGALLGFIFIKQLQAGRDLGRPIHAISGWFSNLFNRQPPMRASINRRPEPVTTAAVGATKKAAGEPLQDEIDLILDKISRSGYESLSKEEKQKLFRASQQ